MKGTIHFDHAISVGLDVVKILTGEYQGEYLLYNCSSYIEDESDLPDNLIEEMLMLKMYAQLTYPESDDRKLEQLLSNEMRYLAVLIPGDPSRIFLKLKSIFRANRVKYYLFYESDQCYSI